MNIFVQVFVWMYVFISLGYCDSLILVYKMCLWGWLPAHLDSGALVLFSSGGASSVSLAVPPGDQQDSGTANSIPAYTKIRDQR